MEQGEFVSVDVRFNKDGGMTPRAVVWDDKAYPIEAVQDIRRDVVHKTGQVGMRYTVRIRGQVRLLFFEPRPYPGRWIMQVRREQKEEGAKPGHCCADLQLKYRR